MRNGNQLYILHKRDNKNLELIDLYNRNDNEKLKKVKAYKKG